jgi:hypothetical protein
VSLEVRRGGDGVCPLISPTGGGHVISTYIPREDSTELIIGWTGMFHGIRLGGSALWAVLGLGRIPSRLRSQETD